MPKMFKDSLVVGFALFAMFFGAGNIIFPPYIGVVSGESWLLGFLAYFFADIGLAMLAILAMLRSRTIDRFESIMTRLGYWPSRILMFLLMTSVPYIAAPRTATVSYELGVAPILGGASTASLAIYSTLYFIVAWLLTIKESKVVDYIGKLLTPILVIGLLITIAIGIFNPVGDISPETKIDNIWYMGLMSGYQTLDASAAIIFAFIISQALTAKGYTTPDAKFKAVASSAGVVGVLMFVVYGGLCYLGATCSNLFTAETQHGHIVVQLFTLLVGSSGAILLGIVISLACLTTAMACIAASSTFIVRLSGGKIKYNVMVTFFAVTYALLANLGLSTILAIAVPIILTLYPAILVMVCLCLFDDKISNVNILKFAVLFSLIFAAFDVALSYGVEMAGIIKVLPLQEHGFGWILPAIVGGLLGFFLKPKNQAPAG